MINLTESRQEIRGKIRKLSKFFSYIIKLIILEKTKIKN